MHCEFQIRRTSEPLSETNSTSSHYDFRDVALTIPQLGSQREVLVIWGDGPTHNYPRIAPQTLSHLHWGNRSVQYIRMFDRSFIGTLRPGTKSMGCGRARVVGQQRKRLECNITLLRPLFPGKDTGGRTGPGSGGRVGGTAAWVEKLSFPAFTGKVRFAMLPSRRRCLGVANTRPKPVIECQEIMTAKSHPKPGGDEDVDEMCDHDVQ
jgi:hypothetical protein